MSNPLGQSAPIGPTTSAKRLPPILEQSHLGPWHGRVRVTPITGLASRWGTTQFEIRAEWHGPPQPGFPPSDRPVSATDTYVTPEGELARAIALRAVDLLRQGDEVEVPDLRAIAGQLAG